MLLPFCIFESSCVIVAMEVLLRIVIVFIFFFIFVQKHGKLSLTLC